MIPLSVSKDNQGRTVVSIPELRSSDDDSKQLVKRLTECIESFRGQRNNRQNQQKLKRMMSFISRQYWRMEDGSVYHHSRLSPDHKLLSSTHPNDNAATDTRPDPGLFPD